MSILCKHDWDIYMQNITVYDGNSVDSIYTRVVKFCEKCGASRNKRLNGIHIAEMRADRRGNK